jgi:hypothetical protein
MTRPTIESFDEIQHLFEGFLLELILAGQAPAATKVTGIRWFIERDELPKWQVSIYGLGDYAPMPLAYIGQKLVEGNFHLEDFEISLESESVVV